MDPGKMINNIKYTLSLFKTLNLIYYIVSRIFATSGDTLEETVLLTQTWPMVVMDTDLTTGQAGSLNLLEMLIFSKKYF